VGLAVSRGHTQDRLGFVKNSQASGVTVEVTGRRNRCQHVLALMA
jgi:hypothetical protein